MTGRKESEALYIKKRINLTALGDAKILMLSGMKSENLNFFLHLMLGL